MDYLRSAYSTTVRWFPGDTGRDTIVWSRAMDFARPLPYHHRFASLNWSNGSTATNEIGEVIGAARPWSNGAQVPGGGLTGMCANADAWLNGAERLTTPIADNDYGLPSCCQEPNFCQIVHTAERAIDLFDGVGPRPMHNVGAGRYVYPFPLAAGFGYQCLTLGTCPLLPGSLKATLFICGPAPTYTRLVQLLCYDLPQPWDGLWSIPASSAFAPGRAEMFTG